MNTLKTCAIVASLGAVLGGCSSTPLTPPGTTPVTTAAPAPAKSMTAPGPSSTTVATVSVPAYLDPSNPVSKQRRVYFDFDDFTVKNQYAKLIQLQGNFLESKPSISIKVEGNADERGSPEYNLALGQKRAEAVVKALEIYGVKDRQLEAVSWGEERPKASGHDEAAWAENRRADLVYPQR
jgi:peptidoglycan-associated lipoprotein